MPTLIKHLKTFDAKTMKEVIKKAGEKDEKPNRRFFQDPKNIMLVAYDEKKIAGYLYAHLLEDPKSPRPLMFLYSIDVFRGHQQKGIGTKLVEKLKTIAKFKKCSEVFVFTKEDNTAGMKLYQKTGGAREHKDVLFVYNPI